MLGLSPLIGEVPEPQGPEASSWRKARRFAGRALSSMIALSASIEGAAAQSVVNLPVIGQTTISTHGALQFAIFAGVMGAAFLCALGVIKLRARSLAEMSVLKGRVAELSSALSRSEALLNLRDQRIVVWPTGGDTPSVVGDLPAESGAPLERNAFLAFGRWLSAKSAAALERSLQALLDRGQSFDLVAETQSGTLLEVQGRRSALHSVLRFASYTSLQEEHARLKLELDQLRASHETLMRLLDQLDTPLWLRDQSGRLAWVNRAYAQAVEASEPSVAIQEGRELLPAASRDGLGQSGAVTQQSVSTVVRGERKVYEVTSVADGAGSAGIASDTSELEALRKEYESMVRSHADTLDKLTTAVATFDAEQKLKFYNQAFQQLWGLDTRFLDSQPENAILLDRLRSEGKLAEQPEWRRWKDQVLSVYRAVEPQEFWWHLPDGRTIRVIANPQPRGGITWVFENLTEKISLESRYNAIVKVQSETLDNLAEGVAVFGSDGRLRLSNPAFRRLWGIPDKFLEGDVHISLLKTACDPLANPSPWGDFVAAATGFDDERRDSHGQTELTNGTVLQWAIIYLPNGQTMLTFVDVTDSAQVERALKEKNEALEKADKLKNDFVQHVSYELRSPLTNIIGFTELLSLETTGPLTPRQREYVEHISSSSSILLTVVNDILDLATVDAGIMELDVREVPVAATVQAAVSLVEKRFAEHDISVEVDVSRAPSHFFADEHRVKQILYNLLSNAANYAPEGGRVTVSAWDSGDGVVFRVHDNGPGMAPEVLRTIFKRFESSNSGRRRGAGLGLAIVKSFVELHGGTVEIETGEGRGTAVICRFPFAPNGVRAAAE